MKRLAEYLADLAVLLGEESNVHLIGIESSSTSPVVLIDPEAEPKVIDRIHRVRNGDGPEEAQRASASINNRLRKDNASADLISPQRAKVIEFPGVKADQPLEWPSINQVAELYGVPIWVGGKAELANVDLEDENREWKCLTTRANASEIAHHLYKQTLRVRGKGRFRKSSEGIWELERFVIEGFDVMKSRDFPTAIENLRAIRAAWKSLEDPLAELDAIRTGER